MDDFNLTSLSESRNEWVSRLMNTMTPYIVDGFKEIFTEYECLPEIRVPSTAPRRC